MAQIKNIYGDRIINMRDAGSSQVGIAIREWRGDINTAEGSFSLLDVLDALAGEFEQNEFFNAVAEATNTKIEVIRLTTVVTEDKVGTFGG